MAVSSYSTTASDNTSISGITVSDATTPDAVDNIIRQLMADIKAFYDAAPLLAGSSVFTGTVDLTSATVNLSAGEIATADLADGAVTTAKAGDGAITTAKLADSAVTAAKVTDGTLTLAKLASSVYGTSGASKLLQLNTSGALPAISGTNLTGIPALGVGQTWQDFTASRTGGVSYQNTTGKPIMVAVTAVEGTNPLLQVSTNGSTWVSIGRINDLISSFSFVVPAGHYYRASSAVTPTIWAELR